MPTPDEILAGLTAIANDWRLVAVGWHILGFFYGAFRVFLLGVTLDFGLLLGAAALLITTLVPLR